MAARKNKTSREAKVIAVERIGSIEIKTWRTECGGREYQVEGMYVASYQEALAAASTIIQRKAA